MALHSPVRAAKLKKQRKLWIWIAVSRLTRRILAIEVGSRGQKPLKKLWGRISHLRPFCVATDESKVYRKVIPPVLLVQTNKLTSTVESVNGQIRNYLARFNRRTKRYSKSPAMAELSLYILWIHKLC